MMWLYLAVIPFPEGCHVIVFIGESCAEPGRWQKVFHPGFATNPVITFCVVDP